MAWGELRVTAQSINIKFAITQTSRYDTSSEF